MIIDTSWKHSNMKYDNNLFKTHVGYDIQRQHVISDEAKYEIVKNNDIQLIDAEAIVDLYNKLYLDKYSRTNPQFTAQGILRMVRAGFMHVWLLRERADSKRVLGVVGYWSVDQTTMTTPLFGYDTFDENHAILYRLTYMLMVHASIQGGFPNMHASGGANKFKRLRGAESSVECIAVWVEHLSFPRRLMWKVLKFLASRVVTVQRAR